MRVTRYEGDKSLKDLTRRLFEAEDRSAGLASAADSLADANPNLPLRARGSLSKAIEPGTLIAVPDVAGVSHTKASQPIGESATGAILERTKAAIGELAKEIEGERRRSTARFDRTLELVNSRSFKAAAKRDEELAAALASVQEHSKASLEELAAAEQDHRVAIQGADRAIADLLYLADRQGPRGIERT